MGSLGFSRYKIRTSAKRNSSVSCFAVWMPFSFSNQIVLARTLSIMLNRSVKSGHHSFGSNIMEKAFILSPLAHFIHGFFIAVVFFCKYHLWSWLVFIPILFHILAFSGHWDMWFLSFIVLMWLLSSIVSNCNDF